MGMGGLGVPSCRDGGSRRRTAAARLVPGAPVQHLVVARAVELLLAARAAQLAQAAAPAARLVRRRQRQRRRKRLAQQAQQRAAVVGRRCLLRSSGSQQKLVGWPSRPAMGGPDPSAKSAVGRCHACRSAPRWRPSLRRAAPRTRPHRAGAGSRSPAAAGRLAAHCHRQQRRAWAQLAAGEHAHAGFSWVAQAAPQERRAALGHNHRGPAARTACRARWGGAAQLEQLVGSTGRRERQALQAEVAPSAAPACHPANRRPGAAPGRRGCCPRRPARHQRSPPQSGGCRPPGTRPGSGPAPPAHAAAPSRTCMQCISGSQGSAASGVPPRAACCMERMPA